MNVKSELPPWLKKRYSFSDSIQVTEEIIKKYSLSTVCTSAFCPNLGECFARKTATFMIMGKTCTRNCRFCAVEHGLPLPLDPDEPCRLAEAVLELGLKYVVITSVTRDDLQDGGAGHFSECIKILRRKNPGITIEILTPDFQGDSAAKDIIAAVRPDVFNHNVETVPRLYDAVRPQADYGRSLTLLQQIKAKANSITTKSGIMVGLGETYSEIEKVLENLKEVGCDIVTIGQYLRPSINHAEVKEYISPEIFRSYKERGEEMGFKYVAAGPFVRSSYHAGQIAGYLREKI